MFRTHKIRLYPNNEQITFFKKSIGCSRFVYNWLLAKEKENYKHGIKEFISDLVKKFRFSIDKDFPFIRDISTNIIDYTRLNLQTAYTNFFHGETNHPKFKKKKDTGSFTEKGKECKIKNKYLKIPKLETPIKMAQELRFEGRIYQITISNNSLGEWYAAVMVELPDVPNREVKNKMGIDLGLKTLIVTSDGQEFENKRFQRSEERRLRRLNRFLSRKKGNKKGEKRSANFEKARRRVAVESQKITNRRNDYLHKITTTLAQENEVICMEDLNAKGMARTKLAKSVHDASFGKIRYMLSYKAQELRFVDRFYPSSKTCSKCGGVKPKLTLSERVYKCGVCGNKMDRDLNAACNILQEGLKNPSAIMIRGHAPKSTKPVEKKALASRKKRKTKLSSMKQELGMLVLSAPVVQGRTTVSKS